MAEKPTYEELEQKIKKLEKVASERKKGEAALQKKTYELRERVKELNCLYGISGLLEKADNSLADICQGIVDIIPPSWQYPEITCSRILLNEKEYKTDNFKKTNWNQTSDIFVFKEQKGAIEVYYLEKKSEIDEGPFLKEERILINAIAGRLGHIIEKKQAEEALREGEEEYRSILNNLLIGVVVHASDTSIMFNNREAENILGLTYEQMSGKKAIDPAWNFMQEDSTIMKVEEYPVSKVFSTKKPIHNFVLGINRPDRDYVTWVIVNAIPVFSNDSELAKMVVNFVDITALKQAEKKLAQVNVDLAAKNDELEQVVYVASHDLRSPLVNIDGYSKELDYAIKDLLRAFAETPTGAALPTVTPLLEQDIPEAMRFIRTSAAKMDTLLTGLLRLSRSGRAMLSIEPLDMNGLISKVIDSTEFQIKEAGIELEVANLPPCQSDSVQVNQVFSNFLSNALKYIDPSRPGIIRITGRVEGERSVYCVEDNGIGIAPDHLGKIFEIFHRLDPTHSEGEGLGLTIVKRIVGRLEGAVWAESNIGLGSRFYVALPKA
ncbi:MAG: PAS domain S-box protein [Desulfobulbaceae bacterium]|nr:PAS domain S-box protein [Desulfobulbaceae bacterium]